MSGSMTRRQRRRLLLEDAALAAAAGLLLWAGAMGFGRSLQAQDATPDVEAKDKPLLSQAGLQKLDQAIANDEVILSRFDAIMSEVDIVKVRALRRPEATP
jgi:hypothetical protein